MVFLTSAQANKDGVGSVASPFCTYPTPQSLPPRTGQQSFEQHLRYSSLQRDHRRRTKMVSGPWPLLPPRPVGKFARRISQVPLANAAPLPVCHSPFSNTLRLGRPCQTGVGSCMTFCDELIANGPPAQDLGKVRNTRTLWVCGRSICLLEAVPGAPAYGLEDDNVDGTS